MLIPTCITCGENGGWGGTYAFDGSRDWEVRPGDKAAKLVDEDEDRGRWEEIVCLNCEAAVTPEQYKDVMALLLTAPAS